MIDPLFQRILVSECKSRKIPVIFDEVFTGFWRLGVEVIYAISFQRIEFLLFCIFHNLDNFSFSLLQSYLDVHQILLAMQN
jgi:hypothetical protein